MHKGNNCVYYTFLFAVLWTGLNNGSPFSLSAKDIFSSMVGIISEYLRTNFCGKPGHIANFLLAIAFLLLSKVNHHMETAIYVYVCLFCRFWFLSNIHFPKGRLQLKNGSKTIAIFSRMDVYNAKVMARFPQGEGKLLSQSNGIY